jgi:hypothetical protein
VKRLAESLVKTFGVKVGYRDAQGKRKVAKPVKTQAKKGKT